VIGFICISMHFRDTATNIVNLVIIEIGNVLTRRSVLGLLSFERLFGRAFHLIMR